MDQGTYTYQTLYLAPKYNGLKYNGPRYNGLKYIGPEYNGPKYNGPNYHAPRYNGPRDIDGPINGPRDTYQTHGKHSLAPKCNILSEWAPSISYCLSSYCDVIT